MTADRMMTADEKALKKAQHEKFSKNKAVSKLAKSA